MSLATRLTEITTAIAAARAAMAEGAEIDVSGLDRAVAEICEATPGLPATERGGVATAFEALADALDGLAADISRQSAADQRQRAAAAYGDGRR